MGASNGSDDMLTLFQFLDDFHVWRRGRVRRLNANLELRSRRFVVCIIETMTQAGRAAYVNQAV